MVTTTMERLSVDPWAGAARPASPRREWHDDPTKPPTGWELLKQQTREVVGAAAIAALAGRDPRAADYAGIAHAIWSDVRADRTIERDLSQLGIDNPLRLLGDVLSKIARIPDLIAALEGRQADLAATIVKLKRMRPAVKGAA